MAATDDAAAKYGQVGALVQMIPELAGIFNQATAEQWTPERFTMTVQNTDWWKQHADSAREYITAQATDPATWENRVNNDSQAVLRQAVQMGYWTGAGDATAVARDIAANAWIQGWSQDDINRQIAYRFGMQNDNGAFSGQAADLISQMQKIGQDYGVRNEGQGLDIQGWAQRIQLGDATLQNFQDLMKQQAISKYPGIRSAIESGYTVRDMASPYVSEMSNILELNPASIDWGNDQLIQKALQGTGGSLDPNGVPTQTPIYQFQQQLRQDPRWGYTNNARQATSQALLKIGQDWGFAS